MSMQIRPTREEHFSTEEQKMIQELRVYQPQSATEKISTAISKFFGRTFEIEIAGKRYYVTKDDLQRFITKNLPPTASQNFDRKAIEEGLKMVSEQFKKK